jgi:DNA-binding NarL/FixJ family response regulator
LRADLALSRHGLERGLTDLAPTLSRVRNGPITVAIVEDNDVYREALQIVFGLTSDLRVVVAASDGRAAVEACTEARPDVVLVDYRLPDVDGVETTRAIRAACPDAIVLALTAAADRPEMDALVAAGAVACLTKDSDLDEIVAAVRSAARGAEAAR